MDKIYDEMEEQNKRYCPHCTEWVDRYDEWDKEYEGCKYCAENDDDYQQHLKKQAAEDEYWDMRSDISRGR